MFHPCSLAGRLGAAIIEGDAPCGSSLTAQQHAHREAFGGGKFRGGGGGDHDS